jgi:hypothetical protein
MYYISDIFRKTNDTNNVLESDIVIFYGGSTHSRIYTEYINKIINDNSNFITLLDSDLDDNVNNYIKINRFPDNITADDIIIDPKHIDYLSDKTLIGRNITLIKNKNAVISFLLF